MEGMTEKRTWKEFQDTGLLWWINRILHTFGWAIAVEQTEDGVIHDSYPLRTKFRGFDKESEDEGFHKVQDYLVESADVLHAEIQGEEEV